MRRPRNPFKRSEAPAEVRQQAARRERPEPLPSEILEIIDGASIMQRAGGQDDTPRALVGMPGWSPFIFTDEKAATLMGRAFPELSEAQTHQAARRLRSRVIARLVTIERDSRLRADNDGDTRPWINRY